MDRKWVEARQVRGRAREGQDWSPEAKESAEDWVSPDLTDRKASLVVSPAFLSKTRRVVQM
jgi:hypothetical protein